MLGVVFALLGIVAIVIFAVQVYKAAAEYGRNAPLWTILTVIIGFVFQYILPLVVGIGWGIYLLISGGSIENIETSAFGLIFVVEVLCWALSFVGMFLVMKHVSQIPDDPLVSILAPPPPPPRFDDI